MSKILLIDDDAGFRDVVNKALRTQGFELVNATDGAEGVARARETLPDLIVCDLNMPGMNGYGVLSEIQNDPKLADIPFIFLTGESAPTDIRRGMNLGADDYLTKPVDLADLLSAVKVRLRRRQAQRERQDKQLASRKADAVVSPTLNDSFLLKTLTDRRVVKYAEIRRIIAYGEYSWVYWGTDKKGALIRKSLKQWLAELPADRFIRVHRGAIVNLSQLDRLEKTSQGRVQIHLRDTSEPILVSLRLAPVLNRKLKSLRA